MPGRFRVLLTITLVHPCNLVDLKFLLDPEDPADSEHVKTQWDLRDLELTSAPLKEIEFSLEVNNGTQGPRASNNLL